MRPLLGDFLARASDHIDAAANCGEPLPPQAARAAVRELARLLTTMAGCASAFTLPGQTHPPHSLEAPERAEHDARAALRHAAVRMRVAASVLGDNEEPRDHTHPAIARLAAAADCLAAGHDLLQTHFTHDWPRARRGNSPWAPLITSTPVSQALLAETAGYACRLAPWAIKLTVTRTPDQALPPPARVAVGTACQWLRVADAAAWEARHHQTRAAEGHTLLRAIPANTAPPRHPPSAAESVPSLCAGTVTTAERLPPRHRLRQPPPPARNRHRGVLAANRPRRRHYATAQN